MSESCWSVYIIRYGDGSLYTGIATDVERILARVAAHHGILNLESCQTAVLFGCKEITHDDALAHVSRAAGGGGTIPHPGDRWHKERGNYDNDRNHHQEFNHGEPAAAGF